MIRAININKKWNSEDVLKNVHFEVHKGNSLALIGPSGGGKSVLLKILAGILPPTSGHVEIDGKNLVTLRGNERQHLLRRMGMLFQRGALFDSLTLAENIGFPLIESGSFNHSEVQQKIKYFLKTFDLWHAKDLFPNEISGGMQKRLSIARTLVLNPEVIFYDNPTAGLDPITSRKIIQLIMSSREKHQTTIIFVTNTIHRAYQLGDQIGFLCNGELIITGNEHETKTHTDPRVQQFIRGECIGPLTGLK